MRVRVGRIQEIEEQGDGLRLLSSNNAIQSCKPEQGWGIRGVHRLVYCQSCRRFACYQKLFRAREQGVKKSRALRFCGVFEPALKELHGFRTTYLPDRFDRRSGDHGVRGGDQRVEAGQGHGVPEFAKRPDGAGQMITAQVRERVPQSSCCAVVTRSRQGVTGNVSQVFVTEQVHEGRCAQLSADPAQDPA